MVVLYLLCLKSFDNHAAKVHTLNDASEVRFVDSNRNERPEVFSTKIKAGKRTYFFDVKATKGNDYFITITESKRRMDGDGYDKHKIFLYKEDFNKFMNTLNETVNHVKSNLLPDYDFDEFDRRNEREREGENRENREEFAGEYGS